MPSTSIPAVFAGSSCPKSVQFGYLHGTAPAAGAFVLYGKNFLPPIGSLQTVQVGGSAWTGYVVGREYDPVADESTIHLVDWRDRLHDLHVTAMFNCEEDDGRFFHILPGNWNVQRKTYVTRELGQFDFDQFQRLNPKISFNVQLAKNTLYSALTILDWMGSLLNFRVLGDTLALYSLSISYPLNLDWNSGSTKIIEAMQQIMAKCGTQMTFYGQNICYVTIRGFTENIFSQALQDIDNIDIFCLLGISSGKLGVELNEQGRRIVVIGDRNKYEYVYPCRANWNPAWTPFAYSDLAFTSLLGKLGLTPLHQVKDLPNKYWDDETWNDTDNAGKGALPARKTRNLMLIRDYLDKIVGKCFVADSRYYSPDFTCATNDAPTGTIGFLDNESLVPYTDLTFAIKDFQRDSNYDDAGANYHYPMSRTLVTDSNLQWIVYCSSDVIEQSAIVPIASQKFLVPRSRGVHVETEEVVNPSTGEVEYRVRVFFDEKQATFQPGILSNDGRGVVRPEAIITDSILIRLSLDTNIYSYVAGEAGLSVRVREQLVNVRNLYQAFVNNQEVTVLRENVKAYWDRTAGAQPLNYVPVQAGQIAAAIAKQALAHYATTTSGSVHYDDICGTFPDGLIDSVQVGFSALAGQGITEDVNFTTGFADDREFRHPFPVKISKRFKDEEELQHDFQLEAAKAKVQNQLQQGKAAAPGQQDQTNITKDIGALATAYGKGGMIEALFTYGWLFAGGVDTGFLVCMNPPFTSEEVQSVS